jgi:FAD:protein FMN transferase
MRTHLGIFSLVLVLGGCSSRHEPREDAHHVAASPPRDSRGLARVMGTELVSEQREAMGTVWTLSVLVPAAQASEAHRSLLRGLDEVDRLERLLSEWQPTSEISRVNAAAGARPVLVGDDLLRCVGVSLDVARWSDGAFDISWASLRDLWDFSPTSAQVPPTREAVQARLPLWNWRNVVVDHAAHSVFLKRAGMAIGLGGVAKGYALDRVASMLQADGFQNFLLFGGGQVRVGGQRGDRPWHVGIQHPRDPSSYFAFVEVSGDASVSTSGDYEHSWSHEGRRYHHILDPATGFPAQRSASVTLISPSALWADAVDTAVFILGPARGIDLLRSAPGGPHEAIVVDPAMHLYTTPGTQRKLVMTTDLDADGRLPRR